jgi:HK97 family phage major capsid protein
VTLTPKTVAAYQDISRKTLQQSSVDVENLIWEDLATTLAIAIDYAALHGSGANNQPSGLATYVAAGTAAKIVGGTNGAAPDWADIINMETEVAVDNADVGALAYITNPKVRGKLKQTAKVASTDSMMVWAEGQFPLNGYKAFVSNQVSSTLTKGTATEVCSAIFYGNWNDLLIGMWGGLDLVADPYSLSTASALRLVAFQDCDIAVRYPVSFAGMLDALTT